MKFDPARFVRTELIEDGARYRVGAGCSRAGQSGVAIGVVAFVHSRAYEIVLQLDNGRIDSFSPMQLFPEARG